jgi:hypothetical protein
MGVVVGRRSPRSHAVSRDARWRRAALARVGACCHENRSRPVGNVISGHQVRRFHGEADGPDLPSPGAVAPVLLGEEHLPAQHRARHAAQLVDPPQRSCR